VALLLLDEGAEETPMTRALTDHDTIRHWAEQRGATPSCVKGTGSRSDPGIIRLDFAGYTVEDTLAPIEWDAWFRKFEDSGLALIVDDRKPNFNTLVSRDSVGTTAGSDADTSSDDADGDDDEDEDDPGDEDEAAGDDDEDDEFDDDEEDEDDEEEE
jgi:hypothetical protein